MNGFGTKAVSAIAVLMKRPAKTTLVGVALTIFSITAHATPTVLDTGLIKMGLGDNAGLGQGGIGVGLIGPNGDAITPGCLCEGWGAGANGIGNYTYGAGGSVGINSATLTSNGIVGAGLAAQSVATLGNGLRVTHTYSYAAGGTLFQAAVTLTNTTAATVSDVRYARTIDWDVSPGYFGSNYTTVYGGTPAGPGGKVFSTSTDPFAAPNPYSTRLQDKDLNVSGAAGDLGSFFIFKFGDLAAGASTSFETFIGADVSASALLKDLSSVGVEAYSYTTGSNFAPGSTSDRSPAYGYGFRGLDLPPSINVPEPSTLALLSLALLGTGVARRRS